MTRRKVAILPWGDTIEAFLDSIGASIEDFANEMTGGWLFGYASALASVQIDTCIICFSARVDRHTRIVNPRTGVTTVVIPVGRNYLSATKVADLTGIPAYAATPPRHLAQALSREGCTHLLNQEYEYHRFQVASAVARKLGLPVYATYQGGVPARTGLARRQRRLTICKANGLVIAARAEAERVERNYGFGSKRIAIIPNPIDLDVWYPVARRAARASLDIPDEAVVAICHCRIDIRRKGLDVLLEAWRRVADQRSGRDLRLHLVGSGDDDDRLAQEILSNPVTGLSWTRAYSQDRREMRRRLSAADLHVLASRHEGFPVAPLEAMACGLPTVLTDIPGSADIIAAGGGLIVPPGDPAALAGAIGRLVDEADFRMRLGAEGKTRIREAASVPAVGARLSEFLSLTG